MNTKIHFSFILLLTSIFLGTAHGVALASSTPTSPQASQEISLIDQQWKVKAIDHKDVMGETPLTISFKTQDQFEGNSGCNTFSGKYKLSNGKLTFLDVVSTERACVDTALNEQEKMFMDVLLRTTKIKYLEHKDIELLDDTNHSLLLTLHIH